jgi:hypothetical protein
MRRRKTGGVRRREGMKILGKEEMDGLLGIIIVI